MLSVKVTKSPNLEIYALSGVVDENFNPEPLFKGMDLTVHVQINCAQIARINSVGVKLWITYFNLLTKNHRRLKFTELAPCLVEQLNMISNFLPPKMIESIILPFRCRACGELNNIVKTQAETVGVNLEQVDWPCTHCGKAELEFDDIPDDYLTFWTR